MCVNEQALYFMVVMTITRPDLVNKLCVLVFTSLYACGNSTGSLLLPLPLFSKPVPLKHTWRKLAQHAQNTKHLD